VTGAPVTLFHQSEGTGEPLLLLNGIAMSAVSWDVVARPLAKSYRVIRCDFRGQLMTPMSPPSDIAEHADDVAALLDHLEIKRTHLIGTSFGGVVGTLVAARYPDRVRSLTTIASANGFDEGMADEVARWRAALPDQWFEGLIGLLDSAHSLRLGDELERVRCPTLVIAAEFDGFVPLERARGLAESIGGASFRVIEGAGHAVVVEQPQRIVDLCLGFLSLHDEIGPPSV
jgi:3-oxoadipate enol-lactonase